MIIFVDFNRKINVMEDAIKVAGLLASIFAFYKIITDVISVKFSRRRDEYDFSKRFITDLENVNSNLGQALIGECLTRR